MSTTLSTNLVCCPPSNLLVGSQSRTDMSWFFNILVRYLSHASIASLPLDGTSCASTRTFWNIHQRKAAIFLLLNVLKFGGSVKSFEHHSYAHPPTYHGHRLVVLIWLLPFLVIFPWTDHFPKWRIFRLFFSWLFYFLFSLVFCSVSLSLTLLCYDCPCPKYVAW